MLTVYKKVEKNTNFLTGIESLYNGINPDRPFLFSIGKDGQNNFELIQKSIDLARIYNKDDAEALFSLNSFHADFLSFAYEDDENRKDIVTKLVTQYFYPYLIAKGNNYDCIKKQANKMNFLTFTTVGHELFFDIENMLISKLKDNGLSDDEIKDILTQISLCCVGASVRNYNNKVSSVYYIDVNDKEATTNNDYLKKRLDGEKQNNIYGGIGNNLIFIFDGNGENNISNYFNKNGNAFNGMAYVVSSCLENSINEKLPLSINLLNNVLREGKDKGDFPLDVLDKQLIYAGAKKHNEISMKLQSDLDLACDQIMQRSNNQMDDSVNLLLNEIRLRCSDTVYYQICAKLGLIDNPNERVMQMKTDRELINGIQELFGINNIECKNNKVKEKKEGV